MKRVVIVLLVAVFAVSAMLPGVAAFAKGQKNQAAVAPTSQDAAAATYLVRVCKKKTVGHGKHKHKKKKCKTVAVTL